MFYSKHRDLYFRTQKKTINQGHILTSIDERIRVHSQIVRSQSWAHSACSFSVDRGHHASTRFSIYWPHFKAASHLVSFEPYLPIVVVWSAEIVFATHKWRHHQHYQQLCKRRAPHEITVFAHMPHERFFFSYLCFLCLLLLRWLGLFALYICIVLALFESHKINWNYANQARKRGAGVRQREREREIEVGTRKERGRARK